MSDVDQTAPVLSFDPTWYADTTEVDSMSQVGEAGLTRVWMTTMARHGIIQPLTWYSSWR